MVELIVDRDGECFSVSIVKTTNETKDAAPEPKRHKPNRKAPHLPQTVVAQS